MIAIVLPLKTVSEANERCNWRARAARVKAQRTAVALVLAMPWRRAGMTLPLVVTLTRIAPRALDDDNLAISAKGPRDQVAAVIGIDDRDPRVAWRYAQRRGKAHEFGLEIRIEAAPRAAWPTARAPARGRR